MISFRFTLLFLKERMKKFLKKVTQYLKLECWQDYTKTTGWISTKLVRRMANGMAKIFNMHGVCFG